MRAKKAGQTPKNPEKLEDIPIPFPEAYRTKLIYDNESTRSRMLVFASEAGLGLLESATTWFMDGTFSTCLTRDIRPTPSKVVCDFEVAIHNAVRQVMANDIQIQVSFIKMH
ncbi:hypothetical protein DPMN_016791 [Dreissena polymorpha]|uniref:Uncharacterized protein n=1 Tax=Dreissena polymorpha TaxID=45954 RepID=A0A9D4NAB6_DREPO|nr:hypothetical protein DPMN_016791 [Dreissena polymorpha]